MTGWRLRVEHRTRFRYPTPIRASYNEARLIPQTTGRQITLDARVVTQPFGPQYHYWDYWGTQVVSFTIPSRHDELTVVGTALVETEPGAEPAGTTWRELADDGVRDRFAELLSGSRYAPVFGGSSPDHESPGVESPNDGDLQSLLELIADARAHPDPRIAVEELVEALRGRLRYEPGVTGVHTTALEAWRVGSGVCQDFAHVALTLLRTLGVPARYVSGYLHASSDATVGEVALGEGHAWIEAWLGDWWALDPTNHIPVGHQHVIVARGRDYADVPPLKGIYAGPSVHEMTTEVYVSRVA